LPRARPPLPRDRSCSLAPSAPPETHTLSLHDALPITAALAGAQPPARAGVAVFGSEVRLNRAVGPVRPFDGIRTEVEGSATDLTSALTVASSLLPSEGSRRVVVLTDAVPTSSGLAAAAERLAGEGIAVDFVVFDAARSADVMVETVR